MRNRKNKDGCRDRRIGRTYDLDPENKLREFRVEAGLSQKELSEMCGAPRYNSISGVELGIISPFYVRSSFSGGMKSWVSSACHILGKEPGEVFPRDICDIDRARFNNLGFVECQAPGMTEGIKPLRQDLFMVKKEVDGIVDVFVLGGLSERHRRVLNNRFFEGMTLVEAGEIENVSPERARQIEMKALRLVRNSLNKNPEIMSELREYYDEMC